MKRKIDQLISTTSKLFKKKKYDPLDNITRSGFSYKNRDVWISATSTRNYLLRDPILDWFSRYTHLLNFQLSNVGSNMSISNMSISNIHRDHTMPPLIPTEGTDMFDNPLRTEGWVLPSVNSLPRLPPVESNALTPFGGGRVTDPTKMTETSSNFNRFIMNQGCEFEKLVIKEMVQMFGKDMVDIGTNFNNVYNLEYCYKTFEEMKKGTPIINNGLLINPKNYTFGIPDLIVRCDYINRLSTLYPAVSLRESAGYKTKFFDHDYYYIVVDIKYSSLDFKKDGIHLLNSGSKRAFKGQVYIYNEALAYIQGYNPNIAFLLGRRWKWDTRSTRVASGTSATSGTSGNICFDRLGRVSFDTSDKDIVSDTKKSLLWIHDMRDNGGAWNILSVPLPRKELYPNMSNTNDYPWTDFKKVVADKIKEITSLWMCGITHREKCHENKIFQWTDKKCTVDTLGVFGIKTRFILDPLLKINKSKNQLISPKKIKNNLYGWKKSTKYDFYIDFETTNDVITDFENFPVADKCGIIYMIGVGYYDDDDTDDNKVVVGVDKPFIYKCFCVDTLSKLQEAKICQQAYDYMKNICGDKKIPRCFHWGNAEQSWWMRSTRSHPISILKKSSIDFIDVLTIFKEEPIVIKGCLGFGLKTIAKQMYSYKMISSTWVDNHSLHSSHPSSHSSLHLSVVPQDGTDAMMGAYNAEKEALQKNILMNNTDIIKNIIEYNKIDCQVVGEIIHYLRKNHL